MTEAQKRAKNKYNKNNRIIVSVSFYATNERDKKLLALLEKEESKQNYIKNLIERATEM